VKWTKEKPIRKGWYWRKNWINDVRIVKVDAYEILAMSRGVDGGYKWAGPITEPEKE